MSNSETLCSSTLEQLSLLGTGWVLVMLVGGGLLTFGGWVKNESDYSGFRLAPRSEQSLSRPGLCMYNKCQRLLLAYVEAKQILKLEDKQIVRENNFAGPVACLHVVTGILAF